MKRIDPVLVEDGTPIVVPEKAFWYNSNKGSHLRFELNKGETFPYARVGSVWFVDTEENVVPRDSDTQDTRVAALSADAEGRAHADAARVPEKPVVDQADVDSVVATRPAKGAPQVDPPAPVDPPIGGPA